MASACGLAALYRNPSMHKLIISAAISLALALPAVAADSTRVYRPAADIVKTSKSSEWIPLDPLNTVVMEVNGTQVIMALAPRFAPSHAANIRTLAHEGYWDGLDIIRVQDGYVTQWGDPNEDEKDKAKSLGTAKAHLPAEFAVAAKGLPLTKLADPDGWAKESGFVDGMPVAADPTKDKAWIPHCYGVIGAARGDAEDSSNGTGLYVIIGQPARPLDLNITVVGRVIQGMEALSALPRGTGNLGFYEKPEQYVPIKSARLLADMPEKERPALEIMKTDSAAFKEILESRRHATNKWFVHSPEFTDVCHVTVPVRVIAAAKS
jgi:peptidylprolyl isomerase